MPARSTRRWLMRLPPPLGLRRTAGLRAQEPRELVLELELGRAVRAELLAQPEERALSELLPERDARAQFSGIRRRRDLEQIEVERLADRLPERRGDEPGGDPACGRRERRALAVPSSLTGRLKTMSARMSLSSSGGSLVSARLRRLRGAGDAHARLDAGVRNGARRGDVEERVDAGRAGELERAVAHQVEPAPLEFVGAAHGVDRADGRDRAARFLPDAQVAADRDVEIPERRAGRPARPDVLAAQHQVVGNDEVDVERDRVERARWRWERRPASVSGGGLRSRRGARLLDARERRPGRLFRAAAAFDFAFGRHDVGQRLLRIRIVEQLQHPIDLDAAPHRASRSPTTLAACASRR